MRKPVILITGANGEIGHGLIRSLSKKGGPPIVALDINQLDSSLNDNVRDAILGNVLDRNLLERLNAEFEISAIYHLAAVLSTRAEFSPMTAHHVNVGGTINMLDLAMEQAASRKKTVQFFFPSSIAVYGMGGGENKGSAGSITEDDFGHPETMYGCNKLHCENLGIYFSNHYKRLSVESSAGLVDFRAIRFPGLISAHTLPSGGTTDYGPEMIHAAAQSQPYSCFVSEITALPFMTMPDAIRAIVQLMNTPPDNLSRSVYHIMAFSAAAHQFKEKIVSYFPEAEIEFSINDKRQSIVDSWPAEVDDSAARRDWGWNPEHDFESAFDDYLIPEIRRRYAG
tara:strand:- start:1271 stop:2290 length:1020 start_codon:yes stop_codon:yes gene_type:complete